MTDGKSRCLAEREQLAVVKTVLVDPILGVLVNSPLIVKPILVVGLGILFPKNTIWVLTLRFEIRPEALQDSEPGTSPIGCPCIALGVITFPILSRDPSFQETIKTQGKQPVFEKNDG